MIIITKKGRCAVCGIGFSIVPWMPWRMARMCFDCAPAELQKRDPNAPQSICHTRKKRR